MSTKVISKSEADDLGLTPKKGTSAAKGKRVNPHVQEIMLAVKGLKAGQYAVYEPADKKSTQTQVLRIRQAFDLLGKPWPLTRPVDGGKATGMRILSRKESLNRYPSQEKAGKEAAAEAPAKKKAARKKR